MGNWLLDIRAAGLQRVHRRDAPIALARQGIGVMVVLSDFLLKRDTRKVFVISRAVDTTRSAYRFSLRGDRPGKHGLSGDLR